MRVWQKYFWKNFIKFLIGLYIYRETKEALHLEFKKKNQIKKTWTMFKHMDNSRCIEGTFTNRLSLLGQSCMTLTFDLKLGLWKEFTSLNFVLFALERIFMSEKHKFYPESYSDAWMHLSRWKICHLQKLVIANYTILMTS